VEGAEDHPELAERDLQTLQLSAKDVVVGIATSGRTPYVLGAVNFAKELRAYRIGLSCNLDSDLSGLVDLAITPVVGPEVLSGSTRLKAGTATKLVLNMLSTGVMVLLGKTFGNLMVDLRATNTKLQARANRIVRILTGLSVEESNQLLQKCGGELKTALVSHLAGVPAEEAQIRLAETGGQVRLALDRELLIPKRIFKTEARADLFLAIDGGGTQTVALVAAKKSESPDWTIVGRGESGPSNIQAVGMPTALNALNEAVAGAFAAAGLERIPVAGACLGMAGAGRLRDQTLIQDWARRINLATKIKITTDADILLAAGTPDGWGLAIIAGTGSMVYAGMPDGRTARGGGWGYLLGDEGSGYNLVIAGLQAVARADDDRGPPTRLTKALLTKMGLQNPPELIPTIYQGGWDRAALAGLAPVVLEAAETGDPVAESIVGNEARLLAETAAAVTRKLGLENTPLPVALTGGLLLGSPSYRQRLVNGLKKCNLQPDPVHLVEDPARGAIRLATALVK
jgi:N-acetylglucosamine kinase-like BadF-type ATPase